MTKEEAISIISGYEVYGCGYCLQGGGEVEEALRLAVDALKQEPKWIPVTERLPDFGDDVLVCNDEGVQVTAKRTGWSIDPNCWAINYCGYDYDSWDFVLNGDIVAWMELPKPYEVKEE